MHISSLKLTNWRNHLDASFDFDPSTNIIIGDNACGKTNIIESIVFLALTKSFRIKQDRYLVAHNQDFSKVIGDFVDQENDPLNIEIRLIHQGKKIKKELMKEGLSVRAIDLIGQVPVVYFSPEEIEKFYFSPSRRRRWLDIAISLTDFQYAYDSAVYRKVILSRNQLLKNISKNIAKESELEFWNNKWLELSKSIILARREFVDRLSPVAGDNYDKLFTGESKLTMEYLQSFDGDNLEEGLRNLLDINRGKEIRYGNTITGPHREDIIINLDGNKITEVGSRGQMRIALLALKMSEAWYLEQKKSTKPIVILDDIFSELDQSNQQHVFDFISSSQSILTATDLDSLPDKFTTANVIDLSE